MRFFTALFISLLLLSACNSGEADKSIKEIVLAKRPPGDTTILNYRLGMDVEEMRIHTARLLQQKEIAKRYVFSAQNLPAVDFYLPGSDSLKITTYFILENEQTLRTLDCKLSLVFVTEEELLDNYAQLLTYFTKLHGPPHEVTDQGSSYKRHTWKGEGTMLMLLLDKNVGVTFRYLTRKK